MSACRPPRPAQKVTALIGARPGGQVRGGSTLQATPAGARPTRQRQRFSLFRLGSSRRTPRPHQREASLSRWSPPQPHAPLSPRTRQNGALKRVAPDLGRPQEGDRRPALGTRASAKTSAASFSLFFSFFFFLLGVAGRAQPRRCLFFFLGRPSLFLPPLSLPPTPRPVCVCVPVWHGRRGSRPSFSHHTHSTHSLPHSLHSTPPPLTRPLRPSAAPPARRPAPAGARPPTPAPRPPPRAPGRHSAPTTTRTRSA